MATARSRLLMLAGYISDAENGSFQDETSAVVALRR
jgi:hypothetical protein